jgi:hypothetical protein
MRNLSAGDEDDTKACLNLKKVPVLVEIKEAPATAAASRSDNDNASSSENDEQINRDDYHVYLEVGENWLSLSPRDNKVLNPLDDTQDDRGVDNLLFPRYSNLGSDVEGSFPKENCFVVLDVDDSGGNIQLAIKDMRHSSIRDDSHEDNLPYELCLLRRLVDSYTGGEVEEEKNPKDSPPHNNTCFPDYGPVESLPLRQLRILKPGDRICTRAVAAGHNDNDEEEDRPLGLILEFRMETLSKKLMEDNNSNHNHSHAAVNTQMTATDMKNSTDEEESNDNEPKTQFELHEGSSSEGEEGDATQQPLVLCQTVESDETSGEKQEEEKGNPPLTPVLLQTQPDNDNDSEATELEDSQEMEQKAIKTEIEIAKKENTAKPSKENPTTVTADNDDENDLTMGLEESAKPSVAEAPGGGNDTIDNCNNSDEKAPSKKGIKTEEENNTTKLSAKDDDQDGGDNHSDSSVAEMEDAPVVKKSEGEGDSKNVKPPPEDNKNVKPPPEAIVVDKTPDKEEEKATAGGDDGSDATTLGSNDGGAAPMDIDDSAKKDAVQSVPSGIGPADEKNSESKDEKSSTTVDPKPTIPSKNGSEADGFNDNEEDGRASKKTQLALKNDNDDKLDPVTTAKTSEMEADRVENGPETSKSAEETAHKDDDDDDHDEDETQDVAAIEVEDDDKEKGSAPTSNDTKGSAAAEKEKSEEPASEVPLLASDDTADDKKKGNSKAKTSKEKAQKQSRRTKSRVTRAKDKKSTNSDDEGDDSGNKAGPEEELTGRHEDHGNKPDTPKRNYKGRYGRRGRKSSSQSPRQSLTAETDSADDATEEVAEKTELVKDSTKKSNDLEEASGPGTTDTSVPASDLQQEADENQENKKFRKSKQHNKGSEEASLPGADDISPQREANDKQGRKSRKSKQSTEFGDPCGPGTAGSPVAAFDPPKEADDDVKGKPTRRSRRKGGHDLIIPGDTEITDQQDATVDTPGGKNKARKSTRKGGESPQPSTGHDDDTAPDENKTKDEKPAGRSTRRGKADKKNGKGGKAETVEDGGDAEENDLSTPPRDPSRQVSQMDSSQGKREKGAIALAAMKNDNLEPDLSSSPPQSAAAKPGAEPIKRNRVRDDANVNLKLIEEENEIENCLPEKELLSRPTPSPEEGEADPTNYRKKRARSRRAGEEEAPSEEPTAAAGLAAEDQPLETPAKSTRKRKQVKSSTATAEKRARTRIADGGMKGIRITTTGVTLTKAQEKVRGKCCLLLKDRLFRIYKQGIQQTTWTKVSNRLFFNLLRWSNNLVALCWMT